MALSSKYLVSDPVFIIKDSYGSFGLVLLKSFSSAKSRKTEYFKRSLCFLNGSLSINAAVVADLYILLEVIEGAPPYLQISPSSWSRSLLLDSE